MEELIRSLQRRKVDVIENPVRRSLREVANSIEHKKTHKPALPDHCDGCLRGKSRNAKKFKGKSTRAPAKFGDIWTVDHVWMRDWFGEPGVGGYPDAFNILDLATNYKCSEPVESKDTLETFNTLQH